MRRASALLMALWTIAVLSIMVLSFAAEAHLQSGINVYVRERNRVNRLTDAGQQLAEVVLCDYQNAPEWTDGEDASALMEDDRWVFEKRELKTATRCTIGPVLLDEDNPESGTVEVEIEISNAGQENAININELWSEGDASYRLRWEMILQTHGIPEELETPEEGTIKLWNILIASWNDWRDADDQVFVMDGQSLGAEKTWYKEEYEKDKVEDEDKRFPRNGQIPDIQELGYVRGFKDYPAVLTGGVINPWAKKDEQISVKGIAGEFGVTGSAKINVNSCTINQLLTVPGIYDEDDDDEQSNGREIAQAIIDGLKVMPEGNVDESRTWWPYRDWSDLVNRVDVQIGNEASNYLIYKPDNNSIFKIKISGESMGMSRVVQAKGYVKDGKVRYIEWRED
ncbi:MAG: hypothetical protein IKP97_05180 [Kiritimatiellae bacterium]|nr:hypothetical protein [Kiritimatiellia bacterium]